MGILEQMQRGNIVEYKSLTLEELRSVMSQVFYAQPNRPIRILTGLVPGFILDCAIRIQEKHFIETYERIYGLIQISLGIKHSLNKIIVQLTDDSLTPFRVIKNGKFLTRTASLNEALNKF